ncbi:MAG: hypothetical protein PHX30_01185 [Candidatus Pacebacteria bacterium]|jgi:hypothetical protein|nr:hypothetical protein [Candidatus Paceibacterota bacterium]
MEEWVENAGNSPEKKKNPLETVLALAVILLICATLYYFDNFSVFMGDKNPEQAVENNKIGNAISLDNLKIEAEDGKDISQVFTVKNGEIEIGKMKEDFYFSVKRLAQAGNSLFLTTKREGAGGYIPFEDNYSCLYRIDLKSGQMEKIYGETEGSVKTISHDRTTLVVVSTDSIDGSVIFKLYNPARKDEFMSFGIMDSKYDMVGNVVFSTDDSKMIYQTAIYDLANKDYGAFGVDMRSLQQQQFDSYDVAKVWAGVN